MEVAYIICVTIQRRIKEIIIADFLLKVLFNYKNYQYILIKEHYFFHYQLEMYENKCFFLARLFP